MALSLPLWKGRKNVTISYSRIDDESINQTFLDTIQFNFSQKSDPEKEPTMVGGVDTFQLIDPRDESSAGESDSKAVNGVLGFFLANDPKRSDEDWVITYFGKILATPAGLDIYVRNPKAFDILKVRKLIDACQ
ncbi:histidinolphosphatase [Tulasnella sp. 330]|nr:histidinolphosphatase [Tulasnella sp. 330]